MPSDRRPDAKPPLEGRPLILRDTVVAQVLGSAAEYTISEVADRNAGIVLKINKDS